MMTSRFQTILIVGIALLLLFILNMIRKRKLEFALVWLIVLAILFIFALMPEKLQEIATTLGIYSPINMIFFLGFVFSLAIIFVLTVTVSRLSARIRRLAQMVAQMNKYMGKDIDDEEIEINLDKTLESTDSDT